MMVPYAMKPLPYMHHEAPQLKVMQSIHTMI